MSTTVLFARIDDLQAQGSTHHLPGKVYVIRITPLTSDLDSLKQVFLPQLIDRITGTGGMGEFIKKNLYLMNTASDARWFIGYFHADRQTEEELARDFNLLVWLSHGHDVQILPIELVKSTATPVSEFVQDDQDDPVKR